MIPILNVDSSEPLQVRDIRHNGSLQVISRFEIGGDELSHAGMPRWSDIYAYKHGRYGVADSDYPECYRPWVEPLKAVLKSHPSDSELRRYTREIESIVGSAPRPSHTPNKDESELLDVIE